MSSKIIKHKDPFLGEIELKEVARLSIDSFLNQNIYYVMESEKYKARGVNCGMWYLDPNGKMHWMSKDQMATIKGIYEALTRIVI